MNHHYQEAKKLCQEIRDRRLQELQLADTVEEDGQRLLRLIEFLLYLKMDVRLYVISTHTHIEDIWATIRDDELVLDFILSLTGELRAAFEGVAEHPNNDWTALTQAIASAYARSPAAGVSAMDDDTFERLPEQDKLLKGLQNNPWLVTLYLMEGNDLPLQTDDVLKKRKRGS